MRKDGELLSPTATRLLMGIIVITWFSAGLITVAAMIAAVRLAQ